MENEVPRDQARSPGSRAARTSGRTTRSCRVPIRRPGCSRRGFRPAPRPGRRRGCRRSRKACRRLRSCRCRPPRAPRSRPAGAVNVLLPWIHSPREATAVRKAFPLMKPWQAAPGVQAMANSTPPVVVSPALNRTSADKMYCCPAATGTQVVRRVTGAPPVAFVLVSSAEPEEGELAASSEDQAEVPSGLGSWWKASRFASNVPPGTRFCPSPADAARTTRAARPKMRRPMTVLLDGNCGARGGIRRPTPERRRCPDRRRCTRPRGRSARRADASP